MACVMHPREEVLLELSERSQRVEAARGKEGQDRCLTFELIKEPRAEPGDRAQPLDENTAQMERHRQRQKTREKEADVGETGRDAWRQSAALAVPHHVRAKSGPKRNERRAHDQGRDQVFGEGGNERGSRRGHGSSHPNLARPSYHDLCGSLAGVMPAVANTCGDVGPPHSTWRLSTWRLSTWCLTTWCLSTWRLAPGLCDRCRGATGLLGDPDPSVRLGI